MREWFETHKTLALFVLLGGGGLLLLLWLNARGKSAQASASAAADPAGTSAYAGPSDINVTVTENEYIPPNSQPIAPTAPGGFPRMPPVPIPGHGGIVAGQTPHAGPHGAPAGQPRGHEGGPTPVPTPHPGVYPHVYGRVQPLGGYPITEDIFYPTRD